MVKFVLFTCLYFFALFALLDLFPDADQSQFLHELALDQAEFTQSLPEIIDLNFLDPTPIPKK